ncbi:MAG: S41 family peptidase [Alphaproteobacteria bacterium]|nr:S41 family peptidase [Alphaproteobacteria bacterium]
MKILKLISILVFGFIPAICLGDGMFTETDRAPNGINLSVLSDNIADIYEKLDGVRWAGKSVNVAIESLENLNPKAHIAATDERVVLVWGDSIIGNYPRPSDKDWRSFGEITTAVLLKIMENDSRLQQFSEEQIYKILVDALVKGIDENGRYIYSEQDLLQDGRILTSAGIQGARDQYGNFRITGIYKSSPADIAGISEGDLIDKINGREISELSDGDIDVAFNGLSSGTLKLHLLTPMGNRDVVLRRATVVLSDADIIHRTTTDGEEILEIVVHRVSDNSVAIVSEALEKYASTSGIILDLRSATGDDIRSAAQMSGLFLGAVPIMRVVETMAQEVEVVPGGDAVTDAKIVAVVSDMTRGTAEAIAAALYEYERAVLIGTPTAGVGRVATRIDLKNGGILELMNKSLKTNSGRNIDGRGVFPLVCLSNIRSESQQSAFLVNVINNDFNRHDYNQDTDVDINALRRGCPVITSGEDEDALSAAMSVKILTDDKIYNRLISE